MGQIFFMSVSLVLLIGSVWSILELSFSLYTFFFFLNSIGSFVSTDIISELVGLGPLSFSSFVYYTNYILNRNALNVTYGMFNDITLLRGIAMNNDPMEPEIKSHIWFRPFQ